MRRVVAAPLHGKEQQGRDSTPLVAQASDREVHMWVAGIDPRAAVDIGSSWERLRPLWTTGTRCCVVHPVVLVLVASAQYIASVTYKGGRTCGCS